MQEYSEHVFSSACNIFAHLGKFIAMWPSLTPKGTGICSPPPPPRKKKGSERVVCQRWRFLKDVSLSGRLNVFTSKLAGLYWMALTFVLPFYCRRAILLMQAMNQIMLHWIAIVGGQKLHRISLFVEFPSFLVTMNECKSIGCELTTLNEAHVPP